MARSPTSSLRSRPLPPRPDRGSRAKLGVAQMRSSAAAAPCLPSPALPLACRHRWRRPPLAELGGRER
uniref:Uncharacterized protein n=1 Tax=Oryza rufipogon TaxID=4529 RepID=A0A0E0PU49_ORYRU